MNNLVKIISDDDGHVTGDDSWHLVDPCNQGGRASLCTQEYFGYGESAVKYETKTAKRGGITCLICLSKIQTYKSVKL